jgi:hypothetical protein
MGELNLRKLVQQAGVFVILILHLHVSYALGIVGTEE